MNQQTFRVQAPLPSSTSRLPTPPARLCVSTRWSRASSITPFISGPGTVRLEKTSALLRAASLGVSNGTDALVLVRPMARGIGPGDAVLVPVLYLTASAEASAARRKRSRCSSMSRKRRFNIDMKSLARGIETAARLGLKTKALMAVDLFGLPADYAAINAVIGGKDIFVIADAAQSFGASAGNRRVGALAPATTTSFFPAKRSAAAGDGGAIFTDDGELAAVIKSLRNHGAGADRYDNVRIGDGRLDAIQAAVLIEKLKIFEDEIERATPSPGVATRSSAMS